MNKASKRRKTHRSLTTRARS